MERTNVGATPGWLDQRGESASVTEPLLSDARAVALVGRSAAAGAPSVFKSAPWTTTMRVVMPAEISSETQRTWTERCVSWALLSWIDPPADRMAASSGREPTQVFGTPLKRP